MVSDGFGVRHHPAPGQRSPEFSGDLQRWGDHTHRLEGRGRLRRWPEV